MDILGTLQDLWSSSGFAAFFADGGWKSLIMIAVACFLLYLGIVKKFEPLLLVGIAFGCLLTNIPGNGLTPRSCGISSWPVKSATEPFCTRAVCWISSISA